MTLKERTCANCHLGNSSEPKDSRDICFNGPEENNCFGRKDHPNWIPMTNGDRVRQMSDEKLAELWDGYEYDRKYVPECFENGDCDHEGYVCECCPNTFLNWLRAPAEEVKIEEDA